MWLYQRSGAQTIARRGGILKLLKLDETETLLPPISDRFVVPQGQIYPAEGARALSCRAAGRVHYVDRVRGCAPGDDSRAAKERLRGAAAARPGLLRRAAYPRRRHGRRARAGAAQYRGVRGVGVDAIIVNAAGCGSTLKEYGHLLHDDPAWAERASAFAAKVKDVSEFLGGIELNTRDLQAAEC